MPEPRDPVSASSNRPANPEPGDAGVPVSAPSSVRGGRSHPSGKAEPRSATSPVARTRFQRVFSRLGLWPRWHNPLSFRASLMVSFLGFSLLPVVVWGVWSERLLRAVSTLGPESVDPARNRVWWFIGVLVLMSVLLPLAAWLSARWAGPLDALPQRLLSLDRDAGKLPAFWPDRMAPAELRAIHEAMVSVRHRLVRDRAEIEATQRQMDQTASDLVRVRQSVENQVLERTQELTEKLRRAEQADRSKGLFLAQWSHEIRTPLQGVMGMLHLLQESPLNAEQRDWLETLRSSSGTLLNVLNDSLDYSKIEAGKMRLVVEEFDLKEVFQRVAKLFTPRAAEKKLELEVRLDAHLPERVKGDADRLAQVVSNLVSNAIKFTETGFVRLSVVLTSRDAALVGLRIEVEDTGIGMDADTQARLFQAYHQGEGMPQRRSSGGTGLGLAIARQLVQLMAGQVGVRSRPGDGTQITVDLVLPVVDPRAGASGSAGTPPPKTFRSLKLLVVDDDATSRKFIRILLARAGHQVQVLETAEAMLSEWILGARFDAVLLDLQLPRMSGLELAARLRELEAAAVSTAEGARAGTVRPGTRTHLIALTASALEEDRRRALQAGFDQFLTKPVRVAELERALERVAAAG